MVAVSSAGGWAGDLLSPALLHRRAALVVALSPRGVHLAVAAATVPLVVLLPLAVARLCTTDPVYFRIGRSLAEGAPSRPRVVGRLLAAGQRLPVHVWLLAVAASPTAKVLLAAGARGVPGRSVAVADVAGTAVRVLVVWAAVRHVPAAAALATAAAPAAVAGPLAAALASAGAMLYKARRRRGRRAPRASR